MPRSEREAAPRASMRLVERGLPKQEGRWPPPAWQCYASDEMASEIYKLASLAEIGLLQVMRNYAWVNGSVPSDKAQLARVLSLQLNHVEANYGRLVEAHFRAHPHDETRLYCPDLTRQQQRMSEIRAKQAAAGRATARTRREAAAAKQESGSRSPSRSATRSPPSFAHAPELNEQNRKEVSPDGARKEEHGEWIDEFDGKGAVA